MKSNIVYFRIWTVKSPITVCVLLERWVFKKLLMELIVQKGNYVFFSQWP